MRYKVGDKITIKEYFNEYEGTIVEVNEGLGYYKAEANGHSHLISEYDLK